MVDDRSRRLARLFGADASARDSAGRRLLRSVGLGLLVLFTVWGFGRAWHGDFAPVEFTVGLTGGVTAAVVTWRASVRHTGSAGRQDSPPDSPT